MFIINVTFQMYLFTVFGNYEFKQLFKHVFDFIRIFIHVILTLLKPITSREIDMTTELPILNRKHIFKLWMFHCHVSFRGVLPGRLASHELKPSQGVNFNLSFLQPGSS